MTNIFDPEYWRSRGVEPIVIRIDPKNEDSVEAGFAQLDQAIRDAAAQIKSAETLSPPGSSAPASE